MGAFLEALAFGVAIPLAVGLIAMIFAIERDGSPFNREFWR